MPFTHDGFGGYLTLFLAGTLTTEIWRWLGVLLGGRLDVSGQLFAWVRAVATALVAGLVTRMVLFPSGALVAIALPVRLGAFLGGVAIYFVARRSLGAGVAGGAVLLMAVQLMVT